MRHLEFHFPAAPWPPLLWASSLFGSGVLAAVGIAAWMVIPATGAAWAVGWLVACAPPAIALGSLLFVVRDFALADEELWVRRLLWTTRVPLAGLRSVSRQPTLLRGSLRVIGNGGLFSFTGTFYARSSGRYRAFVTDWQAVVLLELPGTAIAVSPADPAAFVQTALRLHPAATSVAADRRTLSAPRGSGS